MGAAVVEDVGTTVMALGAGKKSVSCSSSESESAPVKDFMSSSSVMVVLSLVCGGTAVMVFVVGLGAEDDATVVSSVTGPMGEEVMSVSDGYEDVGVMIMKVVSEHVSKCSGRRLQTREVDFL